YSLKSGFSAVFQFLVKRKERLCLSRFRRRAHLLNMSRSVQVVAHSPPERTRTPLGLRLLCAQYVWARRLAMMVYTEGLKARPTCVPETGKSASGLSVLQYCQSTTPSSRV